MNIDTTKFKLVRNFFSRNESTDLMFILQEIDIEERKQNKCPSDYVEVFSGSGKHSNSLGRFCGKQRPKTLISRTHKMAVKFRSDKKVNAKGFRAEYKAGKFYHHHHHHHHHHHLLWPVRPHWSNTQPRLNIWEAILLFIFYYNFFKLY